MDTENVRAQGSVTRRQLVAGALAAGGAGAIAALSARGGTARASEGDDEAWDDEADVVVVGYGAAGAAAAITAHQEGLGSVIVLEAAPEGQEGGNSRVCGQCMLIPSSPQAAITYQRALNAQYKLSDDADAEQALYEAWANELCRNKEWLEGLGADVQETQMNKSEFPELEGSEEGGMTYLVGGHAGSESLWSVLKAQESAMGIDVRYATRANRLVFDPATKEVHGVIATDADGAQARFKTRRGVVLSCGGFENNQEMARMYMPLGSEWDRILGTPYNRGDGFDMVAPLGAKLWHMNNFTGPSWTYESCGADSEFAWLGGFGTKDFIYVGPAGKRFANEETYGTSRHGKLNIGGVYQYPDYNLPAWTVFGQSAFDTGTLGMHAAMGWPDIVGDGFLSEDMQGYLDAGVIVKADTPEELAGQMGLDPDTLAQTISDYNAACAAGKDEEFHRGEPIHETAATISGLGQGDSSKSEGESALSQGFELVPIEAPFYAARMHSAIGNTQGGPVRGTHGEVMDVDGNPVPRLYAAGEFGTIYAYMYNGGGNVSEAMSSGRIAVRSASALDAWE